MYLLVCPNLELFWKKWKTGFSGTRPRDGALSAGTDRTIQTPERLHRTKTQKTAPYHARKKFIFLLAFSDSFKTTAEKKNASVENLHGAVVALENDLLEREIP